MIDRFPNKSPLSDINDISEAFLELAYTLKMSIILV